MKLPISLAVERKRLAQRERRVRLVMEILAAHHAEYRRVARASLAAQRPREPASYSPVRTMRVP